MADVGLSGFLLDHPHSGSAVYTRNLAEWLPAVAPDLGFRLYTHTPAESIASMRAHRLVTPWHPWRRRRSALARADKLTWEVAALPIASGLYGDDLIHSLYFASPPLAAGRVVVTIHDVAPLVLPGYHRSPWSNLYARFMARAVRRADAVITVSEFSRIQIQQVLGIPEQRITVTPEAADARFGPAPAPNEAALLRETLGLPPRFMLYIGGAELRKNIATLIHAWSRAAPRLRDLQVALVVIADFPPPDALYPDIPGLVRELGLESSVRLVPSVREADKPALYRAALALCFPSLYEGFGFTPLEAMASGTPVLVSNATSLPEVAGDAAVLLDPRDVAGWAEALVRVAESDTEQARLAAAGVARAAHFRWQRTAEETAAVYRRVLSI